MRKLKFETIYRNQRQYVLSCLAGQRVKDQATFDTKTVAFKRQVYQSVKQEIQMQFNQNVDRNAWVFDQNELKTIYTGKQTLKALCHDYFVELEASYDAHYAQEEYGEING